MLQVTDLEDKLISNNKELHSAQDLNQALQQEFNVSHIYNSVYLILESFVKDQGLRIRDFGREAPL